MKADVMKIRRELDEYNKQDIIDIAIRFLNDEQIVKLSGLLSGGFDLMSLIIEEWTLEDIVGEKNE
tara:strand:+ start:10610 stop:10807 length:198 start_codon:yes stop_codon:yes gene_type:complete